VEALAARSDLGRDAAGGGRGTPGAVEGPGMDAVVARSNPVTEAQIHLGVEHRGRGEGLVDPPKGRTIDVGELELSRHPGPAPRLAPEGEPASRLFGGRGEEWDAHSHLAGRAGCREGIGRCFRQARRHTPSVIADDKSQPIGRMILCDDDIDASRAGGDGVLDQVQDVKRYLLHTTTPARKWS